MQSRREAAEVRRWLNYSGPHAPSNLVPRDIPMASWWLFLRVPHVGRPGYSSGPPQSHESRDSAYEALASIPGARLIRAACRGTGGFLIAEAPASAVRA
jgi:hypothetical protein